MQKKKVFCWECGGVVDPSSYTGWGGEGLWGWCNKCKTKFENKLNRYNKIIRR